MNQGLSKYNAISMNPLQPLVIMDMFVDAGAVGFHLGTTAAGHFESLLQIASPGEFLFCEKVPEEMKQAAFGMGLQATFAPHISGFSKG